MYGYVLMSCGDERGQMWRPLQSAIRHIYVVESHVRSASRVSAGLNPRITDAEMTVRREWHAIGQSDPAISLATLIELVGQRRSIWPTLLE